MLIHKIITKQVKEDEPTIKDEYPSLLAGSDKCKDCDICISICPKKAISKIIDENGISSPVVDHNKCIRCFWCKRECPYME